MNKAVQNKSKILYQLQKLKKLPDPIRNKADKSNPQLPDQIEFIVLTTPPKYFSRKTG